MSPLSQPPHERTLVCVLMCSSSRRPGIQEEDQASESLLDRRWIGHGFFVSRGRAEGGGEREGVGVGNYCAAAAEGTVVNGCSCAHQLKQSTVLAFQ